MLPKKPLSLLETPKKKKKKKEKEKKEVKNLPQVCLKPNKSVKEIPTNSCPK
jgi:hypothetical protein